MHTFVNVGVPRLELSVSDAVLGLDGVALVAGRNEVKLVAVCGDAWLSGLVLGRGSGGGALGCGLQCSRGGGRRGWTSGCGANHAIFLTLCELGTRDTGVQCLKFLDGRAPLFGKGRAGIALGSCPGHVADNASGK